MKKTLYSPMLLVFLLLIPGNGHARGATIQDLREFSQDPLTYVDRRTTADHALLPELEQERLNTVYDTLFFAPWHQTVPLNSWGQVSRGFREYGNMTGYGKNGRPYPSGWTRKLKVNAHLDDYPQGGFPAITVRRTDFRVLPTREPHSIYPKKPGNAYPFDNLQESAIPAGSPVFVTHISLDRKWLLAETVYALGWTPAANIAAAGEEFMKSWENGRYAAIIRDKTPIRNEKGTLCLLAPLGAIFPKTGEEADRTWIMTAVRDARGKAHVRKAWVPMAAAADKPLSFTPLHAAQLAAELAGEPYGWGGMAGKRDCSSLTRDLFSPFGLWLPRNSGDQAREGRFISLRNLSAEEKEARIIRQGAPWRTLLWTPKHIMLYIGVHQGKPLIFHNFWSIKTRDVARRKGRIIVGRTVITTLHPGRELPNLDLPRADILNNLRGMTLLGEPPEPDATQPATTP